MTSLDEQIEELILERNSFESDNLKLKAQINYLRGQASIRSDLRDDAADIIARTKEQCLNDVKASAVQEYVDSFDGHCNVKVYKSWIKKDGRDYANKLRGVKWIN